ncbi:hypothetical protein Daesc_004676 [Daldinia eschscholtzii]|uniref:CENP-V/GFA domain-containing protein n=1 Tax=Daldinia eschscholtzii TaxID=292717 RepID=A0AAX6MPY6_9PEZI
MLSLDQLITFFNRDRAATAEPREESRTFTARCHCGNIEYSIVLPASSLPLNGYICSCTLCRYSHGSFGSFHVSLTQGVAPEWTNGTINMSVYKTKGSEPGGHGQRWFCPTCGSHNGHYEPWAMQWIADSSLFEENFWEIKGFGFPKSPGDGGLVSWLPESVSKGMKMLTMDRDFPPEDKIEIGEDGGERLRAECQCGGVSFTIKRPSDAVRNDEYLSRFVAPGNPNKWKAYLDFDKETRRLASVLFMPWALIPRTSLEPEVPSDLLIGTMKTYEASDKITKGFCGRCGAVMFIKNKDGSPSEQSEVLNVAVGNFRAPEGAKATNWVQWRSVPEREKEQIGFDSQFANDIIEGQKAWAVEQYGKTLEFDII